MPPRVSSAEERLIAAYTEAALRLQRILADAKPSNRRVILRRIDQVLEELDALTAEYIQKELPIQFKSGSDEAIRQLRTVRGFGDIEDTFGTIHLEAIQQLADDATMRFGNALETVRREARALMTKLQKRKILGEIIASEIEGASNPAARVQEVLEKQGVVALRSGNRNFSLETYAATLTNTVLAEAHNTGAMTRYASSGVRFVQVIERETAPDAACSFMRGKIVALGDSRLLPPYHPNCFGGIRPYLGQPENPIMSVDDPRIPAEAKKMIARS